MVKNLYDLVSYRRYSARIWTKFFIGFGTGFGLAIATVVSTLLALIYFVPYHPVSNVYPWAMLALYALILPLIGVSIPKGREAYDEILKYRLGFRRRDTLTIIRLRSGKPILVKHWRRSPIQNYGWPRCPIDLFALNTDEEVIVVDRRNNILFYLGRNEY